MGTREAEAGGRQVDGYGRRSEGWERQRSSRLKRWLVLRAGVWLAMVAVVVALNLVIGGGHIWGIGFVVISGALLLTRMGAVWWAIRQRPLHRMPERFTSIGPRSPAG